MVVSMVLMNLLKPKQKNNGVKDTVCVTTRTESIAVNDYIGLHANGMGFEAHLTLMFLGNLDKDRADYVFEIIEELPYLDFTVKPQSLECFGKKPVITVNNNTTMTNYLEKLKHRGIESASKFLAFNPHITLKMPTNLDHCLIVPRIIQLTGPFLEWNGHKFIRYNNPF